MKSCGNKVLDNLLQNIVEALKEDNYTESIPFIIAPLYKSFFRKYKDSCNIERLVYDLENYSYDIEVCETQDDYNYNNIYDIYIRFFGDEDIDFYYLINIGFDERYWGYCECKPEDVDYREDKKCCGHGCDWDAPSFKMYKCLYVTSYNWNGDEHDFWDFEDDFYKDESELKEENERIKREEEIKRLQASIAENTNKLAELMCS